MSIRVNAGSVEYEPPIPTGQLKIPCRAAVATNISLSGLPLVDYTVQLVAGDRVLVTGQTDAKQNGIYIASALAWSRSSDTRSDSYWASGLMTVVREGTVYAGTLWTLESPAVVRLGTSLIEFTSRDALNTSSLSAIAVAFAAQLESLSDSIDVDLEELETSIEAVAAVTDALPRGTAETLADSNSTLGTTARRSRGPATLTANRIYTIPNGAVLGERRTLERRDSSFHEERYVSAAGVDVAVLNIPRTVEIEWDGTSWSTIGPDARQRIYYPEDFGNNVGNGNAAADTAAIQAMFDMFNVYPGAGVLERECAKVEFRARRYLINNTININMVGGFNSLVIEGLIQGRAERGTMLEWAGATAASLTGNPNIQFVASTGKMIRTVGSWISEGFQVGQIIMVHGATNVTNSGEWTIEAVTALELTVSDGYQVFANEGPVAGIRVLQVLPIIRAIGCHDLRVSRLEFNAKDKASQCWLSTIDVNAAGGPKYTSGNRWDQCAFNSAIDHRDAANFGVGRINQPGAGSQCDTHMWHHCIFQRYGGFSVPTAVRNIRFYDTANTEGFTFFNCEFAVAKVHVEGPVFSNYYHCAFESSYEWDVITPTSAGFYSCQSEHRNTVTGSGFLKVTSHCPVTVIQHTWQGVLPANDMGIECQGDLKIQGSLFHNLRASRNVLSVNATNNTLTCDMGLRAMALDGYSSVEFIVDQANSAVYPRGLQAHVRYWPYDFDNTNPNQQTFKLSTTQVITLGGPAAPNAVDITSVGSGSMFVATPFYVVINGKGNLSVEQTQFIGSVDWLPARNAIGNQDFMSPYWNKWAPNSQIKIVSEGNTGGWLGGHDQELRDGHGKAQHALALQSYLAQTGEWRFHGAPLSRAVSVVSVRAGEMVSPFPVIFLPPRSRLIQVLVEIVTPFAGTGPLTAMTLDIYDTAGAANDYFATPVNLMAAAGTWKGLMESEMGTILAANPRGYCPAANMAGGITVQTVFSLTGSTPAALTAGVANIYFILDQFPNPVNLGAS